jgi:hypothetical protein
MKTKSPFALALASLLSVGLAVPVEVFAGPDSGSARAGEVSKVIPSVSIARSGKSLPADAKTVVDWDDVVKTEATARARVALDDGSVLNVGSDSSVHVVKHDSGAQQTDLEVGFGKMRSQAQKISKPGGKFEVHTPAGVAGVVGTDFYVSYENNIMTVIVIQGTVKVCNLAGACVSVGAGLMSTVRNGDNSAPSTPSQAPTSMVTEAITATNLEKGPKPIEAHHAGHGTAIAIGILVAIPAIVVPLIASQGSPSATTVPAPPKCNPRTQVGCG